MLKMSSISFLKNSVLESKSVKPPRVSREMLNIDFYYQTKLYVDENTEPLKFGE